eukprot:gene5467-5468_t
MPPAIRLVALASALFIDCTQALCLNNIPDGNLDPGEAHPRVVTFATCLACPSANVPCVNGYPLPANSGYVCFNGVYSSPQPSPVCVGTARPTCSDGIRNGDETAVDFGGTCSSSSVFCGSLDHPDPLASDYPECLPPFDNQRSCPFVCPAPYVGSPSATCNGGTWLYSGSCALVSPGALSPDDGVGINVDVSGLEDSE